MSKTEQINNNPMQAFSRAIEKADRELEKNGKITPGEIAVMLEALLSAFLSFIKFLNKSPQFAGGQVEADYLKGFNDLSNSLRDEAVELGANKKAKGPNAAQRGELEASFLGITQSLTTLRETLKVGEEKAGEKKNGHHGLDLKHEIELKLIELREKVMKKHPSV